MRLWKVSTLALLITLAGTAYAQSDATSVRWTPERANAWYAAQPWLVGSNFVPSDAINQFEMFQAATFNPALNDKELGMAESIGMNTMRVFLQDQLWEQDPQGFTKRLNAFLAIAAKHHIRPMLVLFDSCWDPMPVLGPQHPPIPGVHNSGWVQSPGTRGLADPTYEPKLKLYVQGVIGTFAKDDRILAWDLWNEPDNDGGGNYQAVEPPNKADRVAELLPQVFAWARSEHPIQPLTSGVWRGSWSDPATEIAMAKIQLAESDIITFHNYGWPEDFEARITELLPLGRPSSAPNTWLVEPEVPLMAACPLRKSTTSARSIGASSRAKPRHITRGIHGIALTLRSSHRFGFTRSSARTTLLTGSMRLTSSGSSLAEETPQRSAQTDLYRQGWVTHISI